MVTKIKETLRLLGITHSRPGFRRVVCAIELVLEDEDRLEAVTKEVYEFLEIVSNYIQRTETKPDTKKDFCSIGKR